MAAPSPLLALPGMAVDLHRVEAALRAAVVTDDEYLTELASHLILAGGKRLRPALAVAAGDSGHGRATKEVRGDVVRGGVAVELVHLGSLYHDDVMDEAVTRRGVESVNARWGNLRAILAGDFLLAKASEIAASLGTEVAGLLASTIGSLCQGQVLELRSLYDVNRSEEQYFAAIAGKTASLFSSACRIGAIVGGLERSEIESLTSFGRSFGMAFQLIDDVLDIVSTGDLLGKPAGNDLSEGVYTLPVIWTLSDAHANGEGSELAALLGRPLDSASVDRARKLVRSGQGVEEALAAATTYAAEATACLAGFEPSPAVDHLAATARALISTVEL